VFFWCYINNKYNDSVGTDFSSTVDEHHERNLITKHVYFSNSEGSPYDKFTTMPCCELCTAVHSCGMDDMLDWIASVEAVMNERKIV
jgi:hypothetical protein